MDQLEKLSGLKKLRTFDVGSIAATIYSEDGVLYRVVVLQVLEKEVQVRFCDYGNVEWKGKEDLLTLPDNLSAYEPLAVQVWVDGVKRVADSTKNRARVEKKLSVEGLMVKVVEHEKRLLATFEVAGKKIF